MALLGLRVALRPPSDPVGPGADPVGKSQHGPDGQATRDGKSGQPGVLLEALRPLAANSRPDNQRPKKNADVRKTACTPENYCDCLIGTRQQALNGLLALARGECGQLF